jgi:hypothetical protein
MENGVWVAPDTLPMQQAAATGKPVYGRELTVLYEDGTKRETVENAVPLLNEEGKPWGAVGTSIDLTELKQAEQAQRESEDKLRLLLDSTAEAIYGIDLEHLCTFCNPACLRALNKGLKKRERKQVWELRKMSCFSSGFLSNENFFSPGALSKVFTVAPKTALTVSFVTKDPRNYPFRCSMEGCYPNATMRFYVTVNTTDYVFVWPGRSSVNCGK